MQHLIRTDSFLKAKKSGWWGSHISSHLSWQCSHWVEMSTKADIIRSIDSGAENTFHQSLKLSCKARKANRMSFLVDCIYKNEWGVMHHGFSGNSLPSCQNIFLLVPTFHVWKLRVISVYFVSSTVEYTCSSARNLQGVSETFPDFFKSFLEVPENTGFWLNMC